MPAYLIAEHVITDAGKFDEYRSRVGPLIAALRWPLPHQSRQPPSARRAATGNRSAWCIIEFPDMRAIDAWYVVARVSAADRAAQGLHRASCDMPITIDGA